MQKMIRRTALATSLALMLAGVSTVSMAYTPQANIDMGTAASNQIMHVTLMLKLNNEDALKQFVQQTSTPGNANFQHYISTQQFASSYGVTDAQIAKVQAYLASQGLSSQVMANHLAIQTTGSMAQYNHMFQTAIHNYVSRKTGRAFHRPAGELRLPSSIANSVSFAVGLSNQHTFMSHRMSVPTGATNQVVLTHTLAAQAFVAKSAAGNPTATGQPGSYTVGDVANFYNINPLYKNGITGKGSTIGIVTLANFLPADAQAYWNDIGLTTKPHRITQVHVDGGGVLGSKAGSGETSLDVEQSGGIAPDADIIVYDAPNTNAAYVDAFLQAVSDNKADSISTSWGGPEIFNFAALNVDGAAVTDTRDAGDLRAFDEVFLEAAAQGQSLFAASGDDGAYDTTRAASPVGTAAGDYSAPLAVDSPASDPYITAAGGTTKPFTYSFSGGPTASLTKEGVWGWSYIQNYFDTNFGPGLLDLFSTGGGGGVSVYWQKPWYQSFTRGIERSQLKQSLVYVDAKAGPTTLLKLPGHFAGRNVPDVSLNADPETGYIYVSSEDGGLQSGEGGTSFVAPQLNGINALLTQSLGHRVGFWNPHLYLLQSIFGSSKYSTFNDVTSGDNWFYRGKPGYEPGAGVGTLNVTNFALYLHAGF